jgi:glycine/D-amino acid oxidase-like deaminating enzyme
VVVVGGGISGAFAAYFLARAGATVTLVERDELGGQASGNNPGGLNPLYGPGIPGVLQPLALEAFRLHHEHWDEFSLTRTGFEGWRAKARLNLAIDDDDVARLADMKANYDAAPGFSARWVDRDELAAIEPRVGPAATRGLLAEGDARVDPGPYTRAIADAAFALGATRLTAEAQGLEHDGRRVSGVLVESEVLGCDGVVIATGPWCEGPAQWLDATMPMEPVKGDMVLAEVPGGGVDIDIAWRDAAVYKTKGAEVWLGGTEEHSGFDRSINDGARDSILERVSRVMPVMQDARVLTQTSGLRPLTPDGLPIVGIPGGWENACVVLGGGRKGMLLGAAMGRAAADLLTVGRTELSIMPCSPDRFAARRGA